MADRRSKLRDWAAVAEIVASLGVILSLIYVGAEVRQNTKAIEGASFQEVVNASDAYLLTIAADSGLADIFQRGNADPSLLSSGEAIRHFMLVRVFWRNMENAFLQHQRGLLGEEEWESYTSIICNGKVTYQATWDRHATSLSSAFTDFVDAC